MGSFKPISRIAIIGGGPTGITCAKYLLAEKAFETVDIFEQSNRLGGVWNSTSNERTRRIPLPQLDPEYGSYHPSKPGQTKNEATYNKDGLEFESPMYDLLETNIPKDLMCYSDFPFPPEFPLFPSSQEVLQYLEDYAAEVRHLIHLGTQVQDVRLITNSGRLQCEWAVTTGNLSTGEIHCGTYDAIVVASGHYTVPQTPDIQGLAEWNQAYPGVAIHSKAYRNPSTYEGQKVLVVGNGASGIDIALHIGQHSQGVYLSGRSESPMGKLAIPWLEEIDEIVEFMDPKHHDRALRTKSGKVITGLDAVVFATGYFYSYPFLSTLHPPVVTDGLRARDTYKHFIHIDHPELAFPVINMRIMPFGLAQNQAAVIARMWSGRLAIPSAEEMRRWEEEEISAKGAGKHFHLQSYPWDGLQMNELYQWALSARSTPELENEGKGKLGAIWDERKVWMRSNFAHIKAAYSKRGENKRQVKTIEETGFVFEEWKKSATDEDLQVFVTAKCPPCDR